MKKVLFVCILLICLTGCKNSKELEIILDTNVTTGYSWECVIDDNTIAILISDDYVEPDSNLVGASGKQAFIFKGLKEGNTSITCTYFRPWEPYEMPDDSKTFEISVDKKLNIKLIE